MPCFILCPGRRKNDLRPGDFRNYPAVFLAAAWLLAISALFRTAGSGRASEEAWLPDGRRLAGRLQLGPKGWSFLAAQEKKTWRLQQLDQVVFSSPGTTRHHELPYHRLLLPRRQQLSGEFLGVDDKQLRFRTSWGHRLELPRAAVLGVTQTPGWLTLGRDDFEKDLHRWQWRGRPTLSSRQARSGKQSLLLEGADQQALYELPTPAAAGRLDLFFFDSAGSAPWRSWVNLEFATNKGVLLVSLHLSNQGYHVDTALPAGKLPSRAGWHHVQADFARGKHSISVDERLLWESHAPEMVELRKVALFSLKGPTWFDDFRLCRPVAQQRRSAGPPQRDELWLASGDQLFGRLLRGDASQIEFQARAFAATFGWEKLRGIFFRPEPLPPVRTAGEHVQLWLRGGHGSPGDEIAGVLQEVDERRLLLQHPLLGIIPIEREYLLRLRGVFRGQRLELANDLVALGPAGEVLQGPQPTVVPGLSWKKTFPLDVVPATAELVMQVVQLPGLRDGVSSKTAGAALCTVVYLNGVLVGHLNDHVQRASSQPQEIRLTIGGEVLRRGANVLELRQIAEPKTGQVSKCGVANLVLEISE